MRTCFCILHRSMARQRFGPVMQHTAHGKARQGKATQRLMVASQANGTAAAAPRIPENPGLVWLSIVRSFFVRSLDQGGARTGKGLPASLIGRGPPPSRPLIKTWSNSAAQTRRASLSLVWALTRAQKFDAKPRGSAIPAAMHAATRTHTRAIAGAACHGRPWMATPMPMPCDAVWCRGWFADVEWACPVVESDGAAAGRDARSVAGGVSACVCVCVCQAGDG